MTDIPATPAATDLPEIRVLLFDLGGVLVQLRGIEIMREWLGHTLTEEELWLRWLRSPSVRGYETGRIAADEFACGVVAEFGLPLAPERFLASFSEWPITLYPGASQMLARIPGGYRRAVLTNSNALHWPRVLRAMERGAVFDSHFASHLTGRIKPDADAFEHVMEAFGCAADQVLFLDDNVLNTEAARLVGMHARCVRGPLEAQRALRDFGIIGLDDPSVAQP
jgi:putative hydrolase of the HAD superfamily